MIKCPNRKRKKRLGVGGGALLCPGRLLVVIPVAVTVPLKSFGRGAMWPSMDTALPKRIVKSGVRVTGSTLAACYAFANIRCDKCSWSAMEVMRAVNRAAHRRTGIR